MTDWQIAIVISVALILILAVIGVAILTREPVEDVDLPEDMDAELDRLLGEEEARQRRFPPDAGSVRGWATLLGAIVGLAICGLITFVLVVLGKVSV